MAGPTVSGPVFFHQTENKMAKKSLLSIAPKSEFTAQVAITNPDREPELVEFTFKYRDREALDKWATDLSSAPKTDDAIGSDVKMVMDCATGWELADDFTESNVRQLLVMHPAAAINVYQTYIRTSRIGREKN